jgi:hypothetical protein
MHAAVKREEAGVNRTMPNSAGVAGMLVPVPRDGSSAHAFRRRRRPSGRIEEKLHVTLIGRHRCSSFFTTDVRGGAA